MKKKYIVLMVTMKMNGMKPSLNLVLRLFCSLKRSLDWNSLSNLKYRTSYQIKEMNCITIRIAFVALHGSVQNGLQVEFEPDILFNILTLIGRHDVGCLKADQQDDQTNESHEDSLVALGLNQSNHMLEICLLQT